MSRVPDAGALLARALIARATAAGIALRLLSSEATGWASVTFVGARHGLVVEAEDGAALDAWLAGLAEADVPLRNHLLADLVVTAIARNDGRATVTLEALTVIAA